VLSWSTGTTLPLPLTLPWKEAAQKIAWNMTGNILTYWNQELVYYFKNAFKEGQWLCVKIYYEIAFKFQLSNYFWSRGTQSVYWISFEQDDRGLISGREQSPAAHPVSYPMSTGGSLPGSKAAGAWNWPLTSI